MQAQLSSTAATLRAEYLVDCGPSCLGFRLLGRVRFLLLAQFLHHGPCVARRDGNALGGVRLPPPARICDVAPVQGICGDRAPRSPTPRGAQDLGTFSWSASSGAQMRVIIIIIIIIIVIIIIIKKRLCKGKKSRTCGGRSPFREA